MTIEIEPSPTEALPLTTARSAPRRAPGKAMSVWIAASVFVFSLVIRLLFLREVLHKHSADDVIRFNWDSREYVHLALNLAQRGEYVYDTTPPPLASIPAGPPRLPAPSTEPSTVSHFFGLLRTPGYPAFCAAIIKLTGSMTAILWVQAFVGSLIPLGVLLLGHHLLRHRGAAVIGSLISAMSPTGIGLTGIFLVDMLFALCVLSGFGLLYLGASQGRWRMYIGAGSLFAIGLLVKPALLYWPVGLVPVGCFLLAATNRHINWRAAASRIAVTAMIPLLTAGAWCLRNQVVEHSYTFCSVDAQNLRHFLAPLTEEWAKAGHAPAALDIWANHSSASGRDWNDMAEGRLTPAEVARRQRRDAWVILRQHPFLAANSMVRCALSTALSGWPYTRDQLPEHTLLHQSLFTINHLMNPAGTLVCFALMIIALLEPFLIGRGLADPRNRRRCCMNFALLSIFVYFLLLAGTSFSTGFRILYPIEFAMILLTMSGVLATARVYHHMRRSISTLPRATGLQPVLAALAENAG